MLLIVFKTRALVVNDWIPRSRSTYATQQKESKYWYPWMSKEGGSIPTPMLISDSLSVSKTAVTQLERY
jgi:hypothetical protein